MTTINQANKIFLGTETVIAVYLAGTKVWPPIRSEPTRSLRSRDSDTAPIEDLSDNEPSEGIDLC